MGTKAFCCPHCGVTLVVREYTRGAVEAPKLQALRMAANGSSYKEIGLGVGRSTSVVREWIHTALICLCPPFTEERYVPSIPKFCRDNREDIIANLDEYEGRGKQ